MIDRRWFLGLALLLPPAAPAADQKFERIVIDADFPGGYQVEVADVNGDGKPDLVGVGGGTCAWYENPSWKKRIVSTPKDTPDIISSATADLDGDGHAEIAIAYDFAMNEPKRGKLTLAIQRPKIDDPWTFRQVEDTSPPPFPNGGGIGGAGGTGGGAITGGGFAGGGSGPYGAGGFGGGNGVEPPQLRTSFPSIHRIRWGQVLMVEVAPGAVSIVPKLSLIAAPIFGGSARPPLYDQEGAMLAYFEIGADPKSGRWKKQGMGLAPVLHAIDVVDLGDQAANKKKVSAVLGASNEGISLTRPRRDIFGSLYRRQTLTLGAPGQPPKKGASEVHLGQLKDGKRFLATVEPWHGTDVAIYLLDSTEPVQPSVPFPVPAQVPVAVGPRTVIDTTLKEGHALWVADVDGDGDDEVFAGYRGGGGGVIIYDKVGPDWVRTVIDGAITAQDLRGGDLDGDGVPDVVAIGGQSHNVVWYRPIRAEAKPAAK